MLAYLPFTASHAGAAVKGRSGSAIIRAFSRIAYRFENDGDMLGKGYGRETCNPAGRYLREVLDAPARKIIALM